MNDFLEKMREFFGGLGERGITPWPLAALAIVIAAALFSFTTVEPGQVAVRINNITGAQQAITQPGWVVRVPFGVHSVYVLDAAPQTFTMKGATSDDELNVRELTVRASDGSNFHFEDTVLIFQINGDEAVKIIEDAGPEYGFRRWMKPYARAVLRDEFGRESTISVSNPSTYGAAATRAQDRLNEFFEPHGIRLTQIVTPRPKFAQAYESAIEERNRLGNALEVIASDLRRAKTEREKRLAEVDRDQNKLIQEKRVTLESDLAQAVTAQAQTKREADTYNIETVGDGQALLSAAKTRAEELKGQLDAKYKAKKAEIEAFRNQPVEKVMERLGERLRGVTIDIQPWANDANPSKVVLDQ